MSLNLNQTPVYGSPFFLFYVGLFLSLLRLQFITGNFPVTYYLALRNLRICHQFH